MLLFIQYGHISTFMADNNEAQATIAEQQTTVEATHHTRAPASNTQNRTGSVESAKLPNTMAGIQELLSSLANEPVASTSPAPVDVREPLHNEVEEPVETTENLVEQTTDDPDQFDAEGEPTEEPGELETESAEQEPEPKTPTFRFKPQDEVEKQAMGLVKAAQKLGKHLSLKNAIARVEETLGIGDQPQSQQVSREPVKATPAPDALLVEASAKLAELRVARKVAFTQELDTEKAADLDDQIFDQIAKIQELKVQKVESVKNAEAQYLNTFKQQETTAAKYYPQLKDASSPLFQRVAELDRQMKEMKDPLYFEADKPLILAQMAAKELRIAPKTPGKAAPAVSTKPVTPSVVGKPLTPQMKVSPVSGGTRTTQVNTGSRDATKVIASLKTPGQVQDFLENLRNL